MEERQPRILYLAKLFFKNKDEIKTFLDKQKRKDLLQANLPNEKYQRAEMKNKNNKH